MNYQVAIRSTDKNSKTTNRNGKYNINWLSVLPSKRVDTGKYSLQIEMKKKGYSIKYDGSSYSETTITFSSNSFIFPTYNFTYYITNIDFSLPTYAGAFENIDTMTTGEKSQLVWSGTGGVTGLDIFIDPIQNGTFALPDVGTTEYISYSSMTAPQQAEFSWVGGNNGVTDLNSGVQFVTPFPSGTQCCWLFGTSILYQNIYVEAGNYTLSYYLCRRSGDASINTIQIRFNNVLLTSSSPSTTAAWNLYTVSISVATTGTYELKFTGTVAGITSGIDDVQIYKGYYNGIRIPKPYPSGLSQCAVFYSTQTMFQTTTFYDSANYTFSCSLYGKVAVNNLELRIDNVLVGTLTPTLNTWTSVSVNFSITSGTKEIRFTGSNTNESVVALDNIQLLNQDFPFKLVPKTKSKQLIECNLVHPMTKYAGVVDDMNCEISSNPPCFINRPREPLNIRFVDVEPITYQIYTSSNVLYNNNDYVDNDNDVDCPDYELVLNLTPFN